MVGQKQGHEARGSEEAGFGEGVGDRDRSGRVLPVPLNRVKNLPQQEMWRCSEVQSIAAAAGIGRGGCFRLMKYRYCLNTIKQQSPLVSYYFWPWTCASPHYGSILSLSLSATIYTGVVEINICWALWHCCAHRKAHKDTDNSPQSRAGIVSSK